jgi:hypothetical protein
VLEKTLAFMAEGKNVVVLSEPNELTTQQTATIMFWPRLLNARQMRS